MENLILMGENAKKAAYDLSILSTKTKNRDETATNQTFNQ